MVRITTEPRNMVFYVRIKTYFEDGKKHVATEVKDGNTGSWRVPFESERGSVIAALSQVLVALQLPEAAASPGPRDGDPL